MTATKADIITRLQREILPLQGFKTSLKNAAVDTKLGSIKNAFPNASFPVGAIHEFVFSEAEEFAATGGFVGGILASLMHNGGATVWISCSKNIFPPALQSLGIAPDKIIFIQLKKEKEILWAMEEALKSIGVSAVIGEMQELSFTSSRRLQLAVEQSHVTGFVFRRNPRNLNTTACIARWKITSSPSELADDMPGVGFPRWNVELLKVRNGKPGKWHIEFVGDSFRHISRVTAIPLEQQKKTG
jgi:protein ImuA